MEQERKYMHVQVPWWRDMLMYWLEDQVAITFHSEEKPSAGREKIIASLKLDDLNGFLEVRGFTINSCTEKDLPHDPGEKSEPCHNGGLNSLCGKYLFSSPSDQGTIVVGFFTVEPHEMHHPMQGMTTSHGSSGSNGGGESNTRQIVNIINYNLEKLRQEAKIPVVAAMPNWLGGATCFTHGCSFVPIAVQNGDPCDSPNCWTIELPDLSDTMQSMQGNGVTMFLLDTMPITEQITQASEDAGGRNLLLQDIAVQMKAESIVARHQTLPEKLWEDADDQLVTGRDIFGRAAGFYMPEHGLFVAGILRDLAREAKIEWVRVLNDFGVGDIHTLIHALEKIHNRMATGDLRNQPVVINIALVVMPPHDELPQLWFCDDGSFEAGDLGPMMYNLDLLNTPLHMVIQSLTGLGAVIVAAAGNDSNTPDMPMRMGPRNPAAFPEVISVGAVDNSNLPAFYSDYPSLPPYHNGIATYGGGFPMAKTSSLDVDPNDVTSVEPATPVDALRGIYCSPVFPALSANDQGKSYEPPTKSGWAYWPGTSFATPIISAVAARVLEQMGSSTMHLPTHLRPSQVQWAITTAEGQEKMLTSKAPLPIQPMFGVSVLRAKQKCNEYKRKRV
ncbi:MAG: hypothetical protein E6I91_08590 [Chloroflexi bacterium]|nr:MAG: hypothetical protein E6I91_08590 [Chloroflexota bacterium]